MSAQLPNCRRCKRLSSHRDLIASQYPDYHNAPVGAWGSQRPRLLIVGLAPGLHGAHRTGRAFVGDASGELLFRALAASGWADQSDPGKARLLGVRMTNVVKCLPPQNAPQTAEANACQPYLEQELQDFHSARSRTPRVILALGGVAYSRLRRVLPAAFAPNAPAPAFAHGVTWRINPRLNLLGSFHPSRLNVNTKRITDQMLYDVLQQARELTGT